MKRDGKQGVVMSRWKPGRLRQIVHTLSYPLIWAVNRPAMAAFGRYIYDFALRANGIAIGYAGKHHLGIAEEKFLRRLAPSLMGRIVLDVGANAGHYARCVRLFAPTARIWAFEPHPSTFGVLKQALAGLDIQAEQLALGDTAGQMLLHDFASDDGSTQASLSRPSVGLFTDDIVTHAVSVSTLDEWLADQGIAEVALLKIDTEGFDLNVLKGASRALAERRIRMIQFEFIPANIATRVAMRDFYEVLRGYRISRLCLNGALLPLGDYDVKRCEIYITQILVAEAAA